MLIFSKSLSFAKKNPQKKRRKTPFPQLSACVLLGAAVQRCGDAALIEMESWIFRKLVV